jgi:signal transduction histidine kinase
VRMRRFQRLAELCRPRRLHDLAPIKILTGRAVAERPPRGEAAVNAVAMARRRRAVALSTCFAIITVALPALSQTPDPAAPLMQNLNAHQSAIEVSAILALVLFTCVTALLHLTGRNRWTQREGELTRRLAEATARLERANVFLSAERQVVIAWGAASSEPEIEGELSLVTDAPIMRRVLGFGSWLPPALAQQMEASVERLRVRGESFSLPLIALNGRRIEADGRAIAGRAILRIRDVSGDRLELTLLRERHGKVSADLEALKQLLDALPDPVWMRDSHDRSSWANHAYARAVEAKDANDAVIRDLEFPERSLREQAREARARGGVWHARALSVAAGQRRLFDLWETPGPNGSVGMARDLSALEQAQAELERQMQAHARTLDLLPTAVAIFDRGRRLVFHNTAYQALWSLDAAFLDQKPLDDEILDRLRAARRLPEQADFRAWRTSLYAAYQSMETSEQLWYLPDNRTVHVVTHPNGQGGITYLFDDITERARLESQVNALARVQSETLDHLREGVGVFGSNGRLKLANPALAAMWMIESADLNASLHIDDFMAACAKFYDNEEDWRQLRQAVAGVTDARTGVQLQMQRRDGLIVECLAVPLPDGATLITFTDITAAFNVEKALVERNEALTHAERLRSDFVHHVSYELRTPLNSIIGFTQMLSDEIAGPLNAKQKEYAFDVSKSSAALLAIIDQILDLATIDRGAMELSIADIDIAAAIDDAAQGVQDRIAERALVLRIVVTDNIGVFRADPRRLRQILFALLSNAIGFSEPGQNITLAAMRREGEVVFKVSDQGRGIPPDLIAHVWDRFKTWPQGSRHRGAGLGLSIVRALVEAHHGRVDIQSAPGEGTVVTCSFPTPAEPAMPLMAGAGKD